MKSLSWLLLLLIPNTLFINAQSQQKVIQQTRCGRLHCYFTGPVFVVAAIYVALVAVNVLPIHPGTFLFTVLAFAMLGCLAEVPLGRYRKRA